MIRLVRVWIAVAGLLACGANGIAGDKIYWSTISDKAICRANMDGTGAETIMTGANNAFGGIAFDLPDNRFYSGDRSALFMANLDGTGRTDLVRTSGNNQIGDVELDLLHGKVYWTEGAFSTPTIHRANLDGSNVELVRSYTSGLIEGLAIDPVAGKLYYAHAFNAAPGEIDVSNLDGSSFSILKTLANRANPFDVDIDVTAGKLYWNELAGGNVANQKIERTNLDGLGEIELVLSPPNGTANGMCFDPVDNKGYIFGYNGLPDYALQSFNADGGGLTNLVQAHSGNYISVCHVPEPGTLCLLISSLTLCGIFCRRHWR
jgi:hypothetical protein